MITPRPYQRSAVRSITVWFEARTGNPLVIIPPAGGKSLIIALFILETLMLYPGTRIVIVTHVKELLMQIADAIRSVWPDAPIGFYSAGLGEKNADAQILIAGIQSVWSHADEIGGADLVLVDECHMIPDDDDTMYRRFIDDLRKIRSWTKVVGFTATPYRLGSGRLDQGADAMFQGICYEATITSLVGQKYLCRLTSRNGAVRADLANVHVRGGEFVEGEMAKAFDNDSLTTAAVREILKLGADRKSILVFCAGVEHAGHVSKTFQALGEPRTAVVSGETPKEERDRLIQAFKKGELRVLCNCNILTTGFDAPNTDCIAFLRATQSVGLYVQMCGRGMRLHPGKTNCLVLDFGANVERHGPVDCVRVREPSALSGQAPVKECPTCSALLHLAAPICPDCGHAFEVIETPPHGSRASSAAVMSDETIKELAVTETTFSFHQSPKQGKKPCLRVDYLCGLRTFTEWVCFEHEGIARRKAEAWAIARRQKPPRTVQEALRIWWPHAKAIKVKDSGKYPEILRVQLLTPEEQDARFLADINQLVTLTDQE